MDKLWEILILPICRLIQASTFVEIGSEEGKLAVKVLSYLRGLESGHLTVVDPKPRYSFTDWKQEYGELVSFHCAPSLEVIESIPLPDVYLIDGDHNYYTVINELRSIAKVAGDGQVPLIFFHDAAWPYARRDLYYSPESIPEQARQPYAKKGIKPGEEKLLDAGGVNLNSCNALVSGTSENGVLTAVEDFVKESKRELRLEVFEAFNGLGVVAEKSLLEDHKAVSDHLDALSVLKPVVSALEDDRVRILASRAEIKAESSSFYKKSRELENKLRSGTLKLKKSSEILRKFCGDSDNFDFTIFEACRLLTSLDRGRRESLENLTKLENELGISSGLNPSSDEEEVLHYFSSINKSLKEVRSKGQTNSKKWKKASEENTRLKAQVVDSKRKLEKENSLLQSLRGDMSGQEFKRLVSLKSSLVQLENALDQMFIAFRQTRNSLAFRTGSALVEKIYKPLRGKPVGEFGQLFADIDKLETDFRAWQTSKPASGFYRLSDDLVSYLAGKTFERKISRNDWLVIEQEFSCIAEIVTSLKSWKTRLSLAQQSLQSSAHWRLGHLMVNRVAKLLVLRGPDGSLAPLRHFSSAEGLAEAALGLESFSYQVVDWPENSSQDSDLAKVETKPKSPTSLSSQLVVSSGKYNGVSEPVATKSIEQPILIQFTPENPRNPYYKIFPEQLRSQGLEVRYIDKQDPLIAFIDGNLNRRIIVHFHQLEPFYHSSDGSELETSKKAEELGAFLKLLKSKKVGLVHTAHNPLPHDRQFEYIDRKLQKNLFPLFDRIVVLGQAASKSLGEFVDPSRIEIVEHPTLKDYYGSSFSRKEARESLGFSADSMILGSLGHIKPYKGLESAIKAANQLRKEGNDRLELVIVGQCSDKDYLKTLQSQAGQGITIIDSFVGNSEIPRYLALFNASLFSFRDIWASSSVVLSLSYKVPVIVPRMGCLEDYVDEDNTGYFYNPKDFQSLVSAIRTFLDCPYPEHLEYMCNRFNSRFSKEEIGKRAGQVYQSIFQPGE